MVAKYGEKVRGGQQALRRKEGTSSWLRSGGAGDGPRRVAQLRIGGRSNTIPYLFRIVLMPARAIIAERAHGAVDALPQLGIRTQRGAAILTHDGSSGHAGPRRIVSVGRGRGVVSPTASLSGAEGRAREGPS